MKGRRRWPIVDTIVSPRATVYVRGIARVTLAAFGIAIAAGYLPREGAACAQTAGSGAAEPAPKGWTAGDFTIAPRGFVKLDAIVDLDAIGSTDFFDPRTIPLDGSQGRNVRLHARQSRLRVDVDGDVEGRRLGAVVEMDFFEGTSYALRLRQAYGEWGPLRAGRAWSLFVDEDAIPATLDFESPTSFPQIRQAQIRLTHQATPRVSWAMAVEDPSHELDVPDGIDAREERVAPDAVARVRFTGRKGHAQVATFAGVLRSRFADDSTRTIPLWGVMTAGRVALGSSHTLMLQASIGEGIGRFRGVPAGYVTPARDLRAIRIVAGAIAFDRRWSPRLISTFTYGRADGDAAGDVAVSDPTTTVDYASENLVFWWLPTRAWVGVEYLYGRRDAISGAHGQASRIQSAFKFILP